MNVSRRSFLKLGAGASGLAALGLPAPAFAQAKDVKFSLDFRTYGGNAPFYLGQSAGIYKNLGMNVTLEGASGSAEAIRRLAVGSHDFAFADIAALVEFASANPEAAPKLIMPILDHSAASIMSIGKDKISSLADLKGKKIGVAANSAATKLMPILLELNKINPADINFLNVDVKLRDTMLLKGEIDGVVGYDYTSVFNFVGSGVKMEDIHILYFSDFGFNIPSNSLLASRKMVAEQPELCKAMALGAARAWIGSFKDPKAAVAATVAKEPLLVAAVELQRLQFILKNHVDTPSVRQHGLGYLDKARMNEGLALLGKGLQLKKPVEIAEFYVDSFLPPRAELMLPA